MLEIDAPASAPAPAPTAEPGDVYQVVVLCASQVPSLPVIDILHPFHLTATAKQTAHITGFVRIVKFESRVPTTDVLENVFRRLIRGHGAEWMLLHLSPADATRIIAVHLGCPYKFLQQSDTGRDRTIFVVLTILSNPDQTLNFSGFANDLPSNQTTELADDLTHITIELSLHDSEFNDSSYYSADPR